MKKNLLYAQSGGVTPVINATACGVIETAREHKDKIGKVYAGRNGIIGALTEDLIDTGRPLPLSFFHLLHLSHLSILSLFHLSPLHSSPLFFFFTSLTIILLHPFSRH